MGLLKRDYSTKITEIEDKILIISVVATNAALTTVENKISSISSLAKKQIMTQKLLKFKRN